MGHLYTLTVGGILFTILTYLSSDSSEAKTHKSEKLDLKFFTFEKGWLRLAVNTVCVYNWCILFLLGNRPDFPKLTSQRFSVAR